MHPAADELEDAENNHEGEGVISNEEWASWLTAELQSCAAYAIHSELLDRCCEIATSWRTRFWGRKGLWNRIRRGNRLAKELAEVAPVLARVLKEVELASVPDCGPKIIVMDLCSGFGYLGMFLSELLGPYSAKVERIVLVDKMWAPQNVTRKPHHIDPAHIEDAGWPIRLTTVRKWQKRTEPQTAPPIALLCACNIYTLTHLVSLPVAQHFAVTNRPQSTLRPPEPRQTLSVARLTRLLARRAPLRHPIAPMYRSLQRLPWLWLSRAQTLLPAGDALRSEGRRLRARGRPLLSGESRLCNRKVEQGQVGQRSVARRAGAQVWLVGQQPQPVRRVRSCRRRGGRAGDERAGDGRGGELRPSPTPHRPATMVPKRLYLCAAPVVGGATAQLRLSTCCTCHSPRHGDQGSSPLAASGHRAPTEHLQLERA